MVTCKQCQRPNTLDSTYCRACGHALDEAEILKARQDNQALLADGFKFLSEQRYDEALLVAQTVIDHEPTLAQGHSLRADALERKGQFLEAIASYERALELKDDSTLDRIKLTHLKNVMAERSATAPKPNKRTAMLAGVAATVIFGSLGSAAALWQTQSTPRSETLVADNRTAGAGFQPNLPDVPKPTDGASKAPTNSTQNSGAATPSQPAERPQAQPEAAAPAATGTNTGRPLPAATARPNPASDIQGEVAPLRPPMNLEPIPNPSNTSRPTNPSPSVDPDPEPNTPAAPSTNTNTSQANSQSNSPKPVIDIRPAPGGGTRVNGSQTLPSGEPRTAADWSRRGRELYLQRNFNEAAAAYERALALGADPAITNQRLAQSLEQAGKRSAAIEAYERAAAAFQRRIDRGSTSDSDRSALAACKQAADALRG